MEIKILNSKEAKTAVEFSRSVFNSMVRPNLNEPSTAMYFDQYMKEDEIAKQVEDETLTIWGAFEQDTLVGVSALMNNGHVTMMYMHPCVARKGYAKQLIKTMRNYGRMVYGYDYITVNASPVWTVEFFKKCGFTVIPQNNNGFNGQPQSFVPLKAKTIYEVVYKQRPIAPAKVIAWLCGMLVLILAGSVGFILHLYL